MRRPVWAALVLILACGGVEGAPVAPLPSVSVPAFAPISAPARAVRPWEFLCVAGPRAALLGHENGRFEAWVHPLKLFRDFHLRFRIGDLVLEGDDLVRSIVTRPESTTLVYAWDTFRVEETLCVPPGSPGALVRLEIQAAAPLEVEAVFTRDFQLQWPASLGGVDVEWAPALGAFRFGEVSGRFSALVGAPGAVLVRQETSTNFTASRECALRLGPVAPGHETRTLVLTASWTGDPDTAFRDLARDPAGTLAAAAAWYREQLGGTLGLELPDADLQRAYDAARVDLIQGMVENPFLGKGLVAGYGPSGGDYRPGFAWFFGRDALWTALAQDSLGDFAATRTALDFLAKYQRADGKVPHEVSQSATFVPWFKDLTWAYVAADATPLYLIAAADYAVRSGDAAFAASHWDSLWRAHRFLQSTRDARGLASNAGVGTGWVEEGPLAGAATELYQAALGLEAQRSMACLARLAGRGSLARELDQGFARGRRELERAFWVPETGRYAFALDAAGRPLDTPSVLATVPFLFGLLDGDHALRMLQLLAEPEHQTDWGMRILSAADPRYDPGAYHGGSVWPLFTGWASLGAYRSHLEPQGLADLQANALLAREGSGGHVTEVLSGDAFQTLSTASPHQIWSAAMVVQPLVAGLLGLEGDALAGTLTFAPHIPAPWQTLGIRNARAGAASADLRVERREGGLRLEITPRTGPAFRLDFAPAFSPRAHVLGVTLDGVPLPFHIALHGADQHVEVAVPVKDRPCVLEIRVEGDLAVGLPSGDPLPGGPSRGLRMVGQAWNSAGDALELDVAGPAGAVFELPVWNPGEIRTLDGAEALPGGGLRVRFPAGDPAAYVHRKIRLELKPAPRSTP